MAEHRMFAKSVIQSSRFLKMPVSSRELYFQMGMSADDDGVVDAWSIMRLTDAREDDLRVLVAKGFVQILDNEEMIAYLTDWEVNNIIRKDRYREGIYKNLKIQVLELLDNQSTTSRQPNVNQMSAQDKLSKDKLSKDKTREENTPIDPKHTYGEYKHVKLKDTEYQKLVTDYGKSMAESCITFLDEYIEMKGYKAKSHYLCIRKWVVDAVKEREQRTNRNSGKTQGDRVNEFMLNYINSEDNDD